MQTNKRSLQEFENTKDSQNSTEELTKKQKKITEEDLLEVISNADFNRCDQLLTTNDATQLVINNEQFKQALENAYQQKSFSDCAKTLQVLQTHHLTWPLTAIPGDVFTRLVFEQPDIAYQILLATPENDREFTFDDSELAVVRPVGLNNKNIHKFIDCLNLDQNKDLNKQILKNDDLLFSSLIRQDSADLIFYVTKNFDEEFLNAVFAWDSVKTFKLFYPYWKSNNLIKKDDKSLILDAIHSRAYNCVQMLLENFSADQETMNQLVVEAIKLGDAKLLLTLYGADINKAAQNLFFNCYKNEEQLKTILLRFFRFSDVDLVDKLFAAFIKNNLLGKETKLMDTYDQIRNEYCMAAPFCSRYSKPKDLKSLIGAYEKKGTVDITVIDTICKNDLDYGKKRREYVKGLLALDQSKLVPTKEPFLSLPKSSSGKQIAAALLERISQFNYDNSTDKLLLYKEMRAQGMVTPHEGRYEFGANLINSVQFYSNAKDKKDGSPEDYTIWHSLNYEGRYVTILSLNLGPQGWTRVWGHGRQEIDFTWKHIENLFEKIWAMDFSKPSIETEETIKQYKEKLTEFYSSLAELVWLIGNTQPLKRGSGTFAELTLAMLCMHHGLQAPILKLDFPQLDVLDITFPLSDYRKLFPYFFEPTSLPEHLRPEPLSQLNTLDQMEVLYHKLNTTGSIYDRSVDDLTQSEGKQFALLVKQYIDIAQKIAQTDINHLSPLMKTQLEMINSVEASSAESSVDYIQLLKDLISVANKSMQQEKIRTKQQFSFDFKSASNASSEDEIKSTDEVKSTKEDMKYLEIFNAPVEKIMIALTNLIEKKVTEVQQESQESKVKDSRIS